MLSAHVNDCADVEPVKPSTLTFALSAGMVAAADTGMTAFSAGLVMCKLIRVSDSVASEHPGADASRPSCPVPVMGMSTCHAFPVIAAGTLLTVTAGHCEVPRTI